MTKHSLKTLRKDLKLLNGNCNNFGVIDYKLIISTGDISDVDGFYALMEYAKTGADVLFIMNYPGYVEGSSHPTEDGLGFNFNSQQIINRDQNKILPPRTHYDDIISMYNNSLKHAMTNMAFYIVNKIWEDAKPQYKTGNLYFMIGGVNKIIPFGLNTHKNEVRVYSDLTYDLLKNKNGMILESAKEGEVYKILNNTPTKDITFSLNRYSSIYIDFNGSMSFLNGDIKKNLKNVMDVGLVKGVFVMGGVYAFDPPKTMPSIPNVLNRLSSATMNQLYHPDYTGDFFQMLLDSKVPIPVYIVSNNEVEFIDKTFNETNFKTFMDSNDIKGDLIKKLAKVFYTEVGSPYKPFDYYVAKALVENMQNKLNCKSNTGNLFYNDKYAITLYSKNSKTGPDVLSEYSDSIDMLKVPGFKIDGVLVPKFKIDGLTKEQTNLKSKGNLRMKILPVINLKFTMGSNKKINIQCDK